MSGPGAEESRDIGLEIEALRTTIAEARAQLNAGELVDIGAMDGRVASLCMRLEALRPEDGAGLRADVTALIADFTGLAGLIEARLEALRRSLQRTGGPAQGPAGPDGPKR